MTAWLTADGRDTADIRDELLLETIKASWARFYDIGGGPGTYRALRLAGGPLLEAHTLAGLESALRADAYWSSQ